MSDGIEQTRLLTELHGDPGGEIRRLLDEACHHDAAARAKRREAGERLAELRSQHPNEWRRLAGVDDRMAELLIQLGAGRT